ncbi:hypothetical protein Cgig2_010815 [Carnegiea gigantea]|uniref:allantoinase n=1 Tax=Carnegiea gigantea TaxID=171969 RepID=A0A9Q1JPY2_9CARY|nr:hypothetical protein Cgig2_010815 [Carnegiea gigantea]
MELQKRRFLPVLPVFASIIVFFLKTSVKLHFTNMVIWANDVNFVMQLSQSDCSLLPNDHFWISSKQIVTQNGVISGAVEVKDGKIITLVRDEEWHGYMKRGQIIDFGTAVVMPGLIDVHAHLDDPGRVEWEGFPSGTRAAAAGGITTLIDMPLNSEPSTVSEETLNLKINAAKDNIYVDVGFWGGLVPENAFNSTALERLLRAGALGLKVTASLNLTLLHLLQSFMCPSGINDFPMTNISHIKVTILICNLEALYVLAKFRRPLLVHAEVQQEDTDNSVMGDDSDPRLYSSYLKTRPPSMEEAAIKDLLTVSGSTRSGGPAEGAHLHVVHLSDAGSSLDLLKEAKTKGDSITVETCPHYLAFSAEEIPDGDTRFKCAPPIRDAANKEKLWEALRGGDIDMLSSDHSPTVPEFKLLDQGDFLKAWGGISSLQYVLPVTWSSGLKYGVTFQQLAAWWSEKPAKLAGLDLKGSIAVGNYADIVAWEPESGFGLDHSHPSYVKNPFANDSTTCLLDQKKAGNNLLLQWLNSSISAYLGRNFSGKVLATFVRGNLVYRDGKHAVAACGSTILA